MTVPSWLRWPPNCCETCVGWAKHAEEDYVGTCTLSDSLECGTRTDSRYRCPAFVRKPDDPKPPSPRLEIV